MALSRGKKIAIGAAVGGGLIFLLTRAAKAAVKDPVIEEQEKAEEEAEAEEEAAEKEQAEERGEAPPPRPKRPPNLSGDGAGYNTEWFPDVPMVRRRFINLGYANDEFSEAPLIKQGFVSSFQRDYNLVSLYAVMLGLVPHRFAGLGKWLNYLGHVSTDGTAGKNTLNAAEIAHKISIVKGKTWQQLVSLAEGLQREGK